MRKNGIRIAALMGALALVAAACGTDGGAGDDPGDTTPTTAAAGTSAAPGSTVVSAGVLPDGPSALDDMLDPAFPDALVDVSGIISGGPPPDGIPPIDEPAFVSFTAADAYLADAEPVVALEIGGDARAYPAQVMIWHEIVNDVVGGVPVSVTYCPLCNSAVTYVRQIQGVETTFGTSGRLFNSALVMYDRATESLWTHFDGLAVVGTLTGESLEPIGSPLMAYGDFKAAYPSGTVLDRDRTGHSRDYGANPYAGYDNPESFPFLFRGAADPRARELQRVVGIEVGEEAMAVMIEAIASTDAATTVTPLTVGGTDLVVLWKEGQSSALDQRTIEGGRDVGSVGVFLPEVDGQVLTLVADGDGYRDLETDSTWTVAGTATDGPLAGSALERIAHLDTFWFAWSTYKPGTGLVEV